MNKGILVDGIEVSRLKRAEMLINREINREINDSLLNNTNDSITNVKPPKMSQSEKLRKKEKEMSIYDNIQGQVPSSSVIYVEDDFLIDMANLSAISPMQSMSVFRNPTTSGGTLLTVGSIGSVGSMGSINSLERRVGKSGKGSKGGRNGLTNERVTKDRGGNNNSNKTSYNNNSSSNSYISNNANHNSSSSRASTNDSNPICDADVSRDVGTRLERRIEKDKNNNENDNYNRNDNEDIKLLNDNQQLSEEDIEKEKEKEQFSDNESFEKGELQLIKKKKMKKKNGLSSNSNTSNGNSDGSSSVVLKLNKQEKERLSRLQSDSDGLKDAEVSSFGMLETKKGRIWF